MSARRILVTGGGGFVGSHLAAGFARLGHEVSALDLHFDTATRRRLSDLRLLEAPLTAATVAEFLGPVDTVVHAAFITSSPGDVGLSEFAHIKANLDLLLDALDGALASGARQFVFLSSSGVFAVEDADMLTEETPPTGHSAYAIAKRAGETIVAGSGRFSTLVVRLGYLYGPHETARPSRLGVSLVKCWLDEARSGRPIRVSTPAARRDWTHVEDLAAALDAILAATPASGTLLHLGSGEVLTDLELAEAILRLVPDAPALTQDDTGARVKAPMGSVRGDLLSGFSWTPIARGLQMLAAGEPAA